jgi:hypothetical protein
MTVGGQKILREALSWKFDQFLANEIQLSHLAALTPCFQQGIKD